MMAPSELCFSSQVPYIMEICKETSDGEIFEHAPNDNEIESTVVLSDANTLPEELYDGVSPTIVTILPDDSSDYPLLSLDDSEQHYVTVDDLAMSPLATIPTLSIASEDSWSEVGETLEVTEESLEITEDDEPYEHAVQPIDMESPSDEVTTCTPTIYLIIDEEPYHFISAEEILLSQEEKIIATKQTKRSGKIAISKGKKAVKKKTRTYPCFEVGCNRSYTTVHHLKVHMRNHQGIRPYMCPVEGCFKAFSTLYTCTAHIRTHTGEKPYKCTDCGKGFKTSGDLQKHTRTHTGERPFKCSFAGCDKAFTTSNIRKVHLRSHTGEKPYVCEVPGCGRRFSSSTNYKNHMRIHSGEKPYACTVEGCEGRFTEYSSLYKHRNAHKQRERSYLGGKPCKKATSHVNSSTKSSPNIIRSSKNSIKKVLRDFKHMSSSLMSLHEDESDYFGNDNATLDISIDNKLEVYQLIFNEDLEIK